MGGRNWRVGHQGRDAMYYEELHNGVWLRLDIQGEMLMGPAHHVIYFDSLARWRQYPEWARHRRAEIIARIVSEFRAPDYEYTGLDEPPLGEMPHLDTAPVEHVESLRTPRSSVPAAVPPAQQRALSTAIIVVMLIAGAMGWVVVRGLASGTTRLPAKQLAQSRHVTRDGEPALFWTSIGLHASVGVMTLALGVWGIRQRNRA